jgi:hypothetical protein
MPIDFSNYVYLTPYDVSPTSVYLDAIDYAKIVLPEFQPRQGTPEDAILQAVSYISALNMSAINRIPDRLMSGLVGMMGVEVDDGLKAVADVVFTAIDYEGTIIPQGTIVRYDYEFLGEQRSVYFQTVEEGVIDAVAPEDPLPTVTVEAEAIDVGVVLPIPDDTELTIDTPTSNVVSAVLETLVNAGKNPETSDEFLTRAVSFLGSLSSSFARASQIEGFVLSEFISTVSRCKVFDLTNASILDGLEWDAADSPGHVTIFTYGINQQLTEDQKLDILVAVQNRTVAGLDVGIQDANIVPLLSIEISVAHSSDYDSDTVEENIKSVLSSYFSPTNYRFSEVIKFSEFYSIISAVPGVIYSGEISLTAGPGGTINDDGIYLDLKGSLPSIDVSEITISLTSLSQ